MYCILLWVRRLDWRCRRANRKLKNVASALHGSCAMDSAETTGGFRADRQYNAFKTIKSYYIDDTSPASSRPPETIQAAMDLVLYEELNSVQETGKQPCGGAQSDCI
ncbi:MAG: hypothetical protein IPG21_13750 [Saprospiraceae bacterium]|nr:hypothetical protein [Candidatus Vicinibacter affinis]